MPDMNLAGTTASTCPRAADQGNGPRVPGGPPTAGRHVHRRADAALRHLARVLLGVVAALGLAAALGACGTGDEQPAGAASRARRASSPRSGRSRWPAR